MAALFNNLVKRNELIHRTIVISLISVVICCLCSVQADSVSLQTTQGRYFRWSAPAGWIYSETMSGVTLYSPDGKHSAGFAAILRSRGQQTPQNFLKSVFSKVPDYKNPKILSTKNLPNRQVGYQTWHWIEATIAYTDKGLPVTGLWQIGVANYYGMNDAAVLFYRSANANIKEGQAFLPQIAKSITITNTTEFAGNNTIIHPKNNPNTTGDMIMKTWENKNKSFDEAMRKDTNARRGYEPAYDPVTGERYNPTFNQWNDARGGYVNPKRPTELLNCGTPEDPKPCKR